MADTRALLDRISEFRQRLESLPKLLPEAAGVALDRKSVDPADVPPPTEDSPETASGNRVVETVEAGLRQVAKQTGGSGPVPPHLTARVRRLLESLAEQLRSMRALADSPSLLVEHLRAKSARPLADHFRQTAALLEGALRLAQVLPESPSGQLRYADGLEAILESVRERIEFVKGAASERDHERERVERLAGMLVALHAGESHGADAWKALANELLVEDPQAPIRFGTLAPTAMQAVPGGKNFPAPALMVAEHSLLTARLAARIAPRDPALRDDPAEPVLAALLHDVGMLGVPLEVLGLARTIPEEGRVDIMLHPAAGADLIAAHLPELARLCPAVSQHHERADGTGYPEGIDGNAIDPLARLLGALDTYAAMASDRPHRAGSDPRVAFTESLMLAEQGTLDRASTEKLLHLSFYPVGAVVEMADGSVGVVVANHSMRRELTASARPVIALLTDSQRRPLLQPTHRDMATHSGAGILRSVGAPERAALLGRHYPQWA